MSVEPETDKPRQGLLQRLTAFARWLKNNPILVIVGIVGSVLAFVKAIPPAWEAATELIGRPSCLLYANEYRHSTGSFKKVGDKWVEFPPYDDVHHFEFSEVNRDRSYIYLRNLTPRSGRPATMLVRLPACGGVAQWTYQNPQQWNDLAQVWK